MDIFSILTKQLQEPFRMMKKILVVFLLIASFTAKSQSIQSYLNDSTFIRTLYDEALTSLKSYDYLRELCKGIGPRLTASPNSYRAVEWGDSLLKTIGLDTVYKQEILVPHWVRGKKSTAKITLSNQELSVSALGMSIGTNGKEISGGIYVINKMSELNTLSPDQLKGKIVLYNRSMNAKFFSTGKAYGGCFDQRYWGASKAAEKGAIAVLVRSLTLQNDSLPHTGAMKYIDSLPKIPALAISLQSADLLNEALKNNPKLEVSLQANCQLRPDTIHYNVIGELRGQSNEIITVGGHLDSWDIGEGAHDDGAGIVHSIEALRLLTFSGYQPRKTLRVVLFMNEENGNRGGKAYARIANEKEELHYAAIESDRGGHTPRGFTIDGQATAIKTIKAWHKLLSPYGLDVLKKGWGGVDIGPLKKNAPITLIGYLPDTQRYFDMHHAANDIFENVDDRELELGAASIASLLYLIDKYGLEKKLEEKLQD